MDSADRPQCALCVHFYVTWDRVFPRGCRAFDIKSQFFPSTIVQQESGAPCRAFVKRTARSATTS